MAEIGDSLEDVVRLPDWRLKQAAWEHFVRWCRRRGILVYPPASRTLVSYIKDQVEAGERPDAVEEAFRGVAAVYDDIVGSKPNPARGRRVLAELERLVSRATVPEED